MSREIRFRAWDGKRMWWNVQNAYDMQGSHHAPDPEAEKNTNEDEFFPSSFGEVLGHPEDYVVEQFTGLTDKNRKEIYEGDIVTWGYGNALVTFGTGTEDGDKFITGWLADDTFLDVDCTIIGNIHQNPELLTERK